MLVTMIPLLNDAKKNRYCVCAPNWFDLYALKSAVEVAEENNAPMVLDIARLKEETDEEFNIKAKIAAKYAREASVPIALNLDHGSDYEYIVNAISSDCSSVMCDRSAETYEDNVEQVAEIVKIAHAVGKSVEAELGHVGINVGSEDNESSGALPQRTTMESEEDKRKNYTNIDQAIDYVKKTNVDALAVAVGTVHGLYPKGFKPSLDFELLKELDEAIDIPLVLHGGSGTGEEALAKAATMGMSKVNIGSDLIKEGAIYMGKYSDEHPDASTEELMKEYYKGYKARLSNYIKVLGAAGKADNFR